MPAPPRIPAIRPQALARVLIAATLLTGITLVAPHASAAHGSAAAFADSGTVTFVTDQTGADLDPANNEVAGASAIARNIDDGLVEPAGSSLSRFKPMLATSWTTNAAKSVWTFRLRHGVMFHTGRCCVTAADVQYNLQRDVLAGLVNSGLMARFLSDPKKQIKVVDTYTVQFDLGRPQPLFINELSSLYAGFILDSHALKAHATKSDPWAHQWAQFADIGTGPYTIQSWQHGQQITLARFPAYWGGWSGRHFSKAIIRTIPEAPTRRELLEKGQADITFDLTPQDNLALQHSPAAQVVAPYGTEVQYAYMTQAGPLASTAARQALSYAMNYDAVIKGTWKGFARRAYGCLPSTMLGYDPHQFHYQTNLPKARDLLQNAGVKPGTTLTYMSYTAQENQNGLILQAQLAQLGINLKVQLVTEATLTSILYSNTPLSKRPNMIAFGWWPDYNDPYDECNILLNSTQAGANGANGGFYHNKTVDTLLNRMKYATGEELVSLAHQMQEVSALDPSAIWMNEPAQVTVLGKRIHGYVFNPVELQTYDFYSMYRA